MTCPNRDLRVMHLRLTRWTKKRVSKGRCTVARHAGREGAPTSMTALKPVTSSGSEVTVAIRITPTQRATGP